MSGEMSWIVSTVWMMIMLPTSHVQGTITYDPPGLHRVYEGDSVQMFWVFINESIISFYVDFEYNENVMLYVNSSGTEVKHPDYVNRITSNINNTHMGFRLDDVTTADAGRYHMIGQFHSNSQYIGIHDSRAELFIYVPVYIYDTTSPAGTIVEGDTVTLTCAAMSQSQPPENRPPILYDWYRNGDFNNPIVPDNRHNMSLMAEGSWLQVSPIDRTDDLYSCAPCEDTIQCGQYTWNFRLIVMYGPDRADLHISVAEGDPIDITCTADCSDSCNYSWSKVNNQTFSSSGSQLEIVTSDRADSGSYVCNASNTYGSTTGQTDVIVIY